MAPPPDLEQPPPGTLSAVPDDGVAAATTGTVAFGLATVAALLGHTWLAENGHGWWLWTAVGGTVIGALFRAFAGHRARVYRQHAAAGGPTAPAAPDER
jgi:uncharacterized membrane protein YfcA